MTPDKKSRRAHFDDLFESLPGTNVERIRWVCAAIAVKEGTVRIWRLKSPTRVISARSLELLRRAVAVLQADRPA